jgi:hypothetical protein
MHIIATYDILPCNFGCVLRREFLCNLPFNAEWNGNFFHQKSMTPGFNKIKKTRLVHKNNRFL